MRKPSFALRTTFSVSRVIVCVWDGRCVQRSMMQMLARTRRSLSKLHQQVMNNQGDLEERIATDIAHLNVRCKEL